MLGGAFHLAVVRISAETHPAVRAAGCCSEPGTMWCRSRALAGGGTVTCWSCAAAEEQGRLVRGSVELPLNSAAPTHQLGLVTARAEEFPNYSL